LEWAAARGNSGSPTTTEEKLVEERIFLDEARLLDAQRKVRDLLAEGARRIDSGNDPQDDWVEGLVIEWVPTPNETAYWLLVLRASQNRAIGVVEALLDHASMETPVREHLIGLLYDRLQSGEGADLDETALTTLLRDLVRRTVAPGELVGPTRFLLSVLDLTDDPNTRRIVVDGQPAEEKTLAQPSATRLAWQVHKLASSRRRPLRMRLPFGRMSRRWRDDDGGQRGGPSEA
jgi:hypothetical protein